ncbi:hypothetical protein [Bacillus proteolyticus]
MQLVPTIINAEFGHLGGVRERETQERLNPENLLIDIRRSL